MNGHIQQRVYSRLIPDLTTGCLLWTGALDTEGYGRVWDSRTKSQSRIHRLMWELTNGPIPDGLVIDHVKARGCVNRHCANLDHLEAVTQGENRHRDTRTHCRRGHEKTPENTYGRRECRQCAKDRRETTRRP